MAEFVWPLRLGEYLGHLADAGKLARPLMENVYRIITEDNRKGILGRVQADDTPMPGTKYRLGLGQANVRARPRTGPNLGLTVGSFKGLSAPSNGNLTSSQYRRLSGPDLAPRGEESRVIANLGGEILNSSDFSQWDVKMGWADIVSSSGFPFLDAHDQGLGHLPRRHVKGIRLWGRNRIGEAIHEWIQWMLSTA
jgi:hypothetical protein